VPESAEPSTLVLRLSSYEAWPGESSTELDPAFAHATSQAEQAIEAVLKEAFERQGAGDLGGARQSYQCAERLLGSEVSPRRVLVLVSLAEIDRAEGQVVQAAAELDRALAMAPEHMGALRARADIARDGGEVSLAAALLGRLVPKLETSAKRVEVLLVVAEESLKAARSAIELASEFMPGSTHLLERLRAIYEAAGSWEAAVSAAVQIAELVPDRRQRARALVEAARLCSERARHTARAVALYEAAIQDDPEVAGAFEAIEAELVRAGDNAGLASAYERQLERLAAAGAILQQPELWRKLARLKRDHLDDPHAAIAALDRLIQISPDDLPARLELGALLETAGETTLATRVLEAAATLRPTEIEVYRALTRLFTRAADEDRVYAACSVLVALGEADLDEQLTFAQHRPEALPSPRTTLDEDAWPQLLPAGHPVALDELAIAIEPAALDAVARLTRSSLPPPGERVDLRKTTVSAARCFGYAAQLFGLPEPEIYLEPGETRVGARLLPRRKLGLVLGRPVLSGRNVGELAFLAAHHLTYTRSGWRMISLLGSLEEIRAVLVAGMAVVRPDLPALTAVGPRAQELAQVLSERMDGPSRDSVARAVDTIMAAGGTLDVLGWLRSVEETACRAGLLACGDVTVATNVLAVSGTAPGGLSAAERARSLLPFSVSQRHSALRHWLGVAIG
jgi:tetratricopeptide (TPR) repeat protein